MNLTSSPSLSRCLQQIAILIITLCVHVHGITNNGDTAAAAAAAAATTGISYASSSHNDIEARQSNGFRPSPIIDFVPSDATTTTTNTNYMQSNSGYYATPQAHQVTTNNNGEGDAQPSALDLAQLRYDMEKRFTFPNDQNKHQYQQQQQQKFTNNNYNYLQTSVPTNLQKTPILTYRDPYTNENYPFTANDGQQSIELGNQHYNDYTQQSNGQAYTVQSTLLVGNGQPSSAYKRPGYVIDEKPNANYQQSYHINKSPTSTTGHRYQQRPHGIDNFNRNDGIDIIRGRPYVPTERPQRLSYDSHNYPPPSYYQRPKHEQPNFQSSPQRQDTSNYIGSPTTHETAPSTYFFDGASPPAHPAAGTHQHSNYANNFGNYLQGEQYLSNNNRPQSSFVRPSSHYGNYPEYQQGEIPPPPRPPSSGAFGRPPPHYAPHRPQSAPPPSAPGGLASLASLFTTTQQYAPQFTNLLLGTLTGGGGSTSTTNSHTNAGTRPLNMQIIRALENIARNDDLQCVPKVLCQMIAGQTQRGQLPSFITSPSITNFLTAVPASSSALIYGRAALLGLSGGELSCAQTYNKCPKDEYEILHYLNNHRGGFFKFFSEPDPEPERATKRPVAAAADTEGAAGTSIFSLLSALTGNPLAQATTPPPRTTPQPTLASLDITSGISNFFSNVLSDYLGGGSDVEYQRRKRHRRSRQRRSTLFNDDMKEINADIEQDIKTEALPTDFHDDEDDEDTNQDDNVEGRILHKDLRALDEPSFFPETEVDEVRLSHAPNHDDGYHHGIHDDTVDSAPAPFDNDLKKVIINFNEVKSSRKLKFPSETKIRQYKNVDSSEGHGQRIHNVRFQDDDEASDEENRFTHQHQGVGLGLGPAKKFRRGKNIVFVEEPDDQQSAYSQQQQHHTVAPNGIRIIFPDHYETHIRKGRILNRPSYASTYADYYVRNTDNDQDKFIVSDSKRRQPHYHDATTTGQQQQQQQSYDRTRYQYNRYQSTSTNHNYQSNYNGNGNYNYPNANYVSSNRYSSGYQSSHINAGRTTRSPRHEDDKNVYVTNGNGVTEYYITPDGRKVYLK